MATKKVELRRKNDGTFEEEIVVRSDWDIIDNVPAVFPPEAHTHPVEDIDATGTLDSTTFLRGDGVWSAAGDIITIENAAGDGLVWDNVNNEFDVMKASTEQAEEGAVDTHFMTPLKTAQAIAALSGGAVSETLTVTLDSGNWSGTAPVTQTVNVTGILETDNPIIDIVFSGTYNTDTARAIEWNKIYRIDTLNAQITAFAIEAPLINLPIQIKVVR